MISCVSVKAAHVTKKASDSDSKKPSEIRQTTTSFFSKMLQGGEGFYQLAARDV